MKLAIGSLESAAIDSEPVWSLHRDFMLDPDRQLVESIRRFGLLRPIIARKKENRIELICGARRAEAFRQLSSSPKIPCFFVEPWISDRDLVQLIIEDQKLSGPLSPIETAYLIDLLQRIDTAVDDKAIQDITGTRSATEQTRLSSLLELEKPLILALHQGSLSVKIALALKDLRKKERTFAFDLINRLSLNAGKQRRLLELARIVAVSERIALDEVFTSHFPELCSGTIDNIPQTSARMLKKLYEMSHPQISAAQKSFNEKVGRLKLPNRCRLDPAPAFERETVRFSAEFDDLDSFQKTWHRIKDSM